MPSNIPFFVTKERKKVPLYGMLFIFIVGRQKSFEIVTRWFNLQHTCRQFRWLGWVNVFVLYLIHRNWNALLIESFHFAHLRRFRADALLFIAGSNSQCCQVKETCRFTASRTAWLRLRSVWLFFGTINFSDVSENYFNIWWEIYLHGITPADL